MPRKTIEVGKILNMVNAYLANENTTPDGREAMCAMLEGVLFETGTYRGYRYLDTAEIEGNGSRRHYFAASKIAGDYYAAAETQTRMIGV